MADMNENGIICTRGQIGFNLRAPLAHKSVFVSFALVTRLKEIFAADVDVEFHDPLTGLNIKYMAEVGALIGDRVNTKNEIFITEITVGELTC